MPAMWWTAPAMARKAISWATPNPMTRWCWTWACPRWMACGCWSNTVAGFDAGADGYLAKPCYTEELLARLRALLRRAAGFATADIEIGNLHIDTRASRVTFAGN